MRFDPAPPSLPRSTRMVEIKKHLGDLCSGGRRQGCWLLILWASQEGERKVAQRSIGQERFGFAGRDRAASSLDAPVSLIEWSPVAS